MNFATTLTAGDSYEYTYKDKLLPYEKVEKIVELINSGLGNQVTEEMRHKISDIVSD